MKEKAARKNLKSMAMRQNLGIGAGSLASGLGLAPSGALGASSLLSNPLGNVNLSHVSNNSLEEMELESTLV